jgi:uncharacterized protein (DUF952 family)
MKVVGTAMDPLIYKILPKDLWATAMECGQLLGTADDIRDGYIHLSTGAQLRGTLEKHFRGAADLVLIAFDPADFDESLKWEPSRGGDVFPHLYAALQTLLAKSVLPLALGSDGVPILPPEVN